MDPKENGNLPMHPTEEMHTPVDGHPGRTQCVLAQPGLTKREHFAAMAMQGLALHAIGGAACDSEHRLKYTAREAVKIADALLRALAAGGEG